MTLFRTLVLSATVAALTGCQTDDGLERRFATVAIGDARTQLLSVMQVAPSERERHELPLATWERAVWVDADGRRLQATLVLDRVVAKSIR